MSGLPRGVSAQRGPFAQGEPAGATEKFYRPPQPQTDNKGNPIICPTCQGSGYLGRTAAFELLEVDDKMRKLISAGASLTEIKGQARKNKMLYLQEQALALVMQGVTSVQEVIRVTREEQGGEKQKSGAGDVEKA